METVTKNSLSAREVDSLLYPLMGWSKEGFQNFIESGVLTDVVEVARDGRTSIIKIQERDMAGTPWQNGTATLSQFKRLFQQAPTEDKAAWSNFVFLFKAWSFTASWWDENTVTKQLRNEWRKEVGLQELKI